MEPTQAVPAGPDDDSDAPPPVEVAAAAPAVPAGSAEPELAARIESLLESLAGRPVGEHGEVYAVIHADLQRALERIDELAR